MYARYGTVLLLLIIACSSAEETSTIRSTGSIDTLKGATTGVTYEINTAVERPAEAEFLKIATQTEFFAGYYCLKGDLIVGFAGPVDSVEAKQLRQNIEALGTSSNCKDREFASHAAEVILESKKYNFLQLRSWRDQLTDEFGQTRGAIGIGIDYVNNRIRMRALPGESGAMDLALAHDLPIDAYKVIEGAQWQLASCASLGTTGSDLRKCSSPIPGGVEIHFTAEGGTPLDAACSIAVVARRWDAVSATYANGLVTASHCTRTMFTMESDYVYHPGTDDPSHPGYFHSTEHIGSEYLDPAGTSCDGYTCRNSDSAWAWTFEPMQRGTIAQTYAVYGSSSPPPVLDCCNTPPMGSPCTRCVVNAAHPRFYIRGTSDTLLVNMPVERMGRTSGWSTGHITDGCSDENDGNGHRYKCTALSTNWLEGGDSGGPVFKWLWEYGDVVELLGVAWGADYDHPDERMAFSPWSKVTADLGALDISLAPDFQLMDQNANDIGIGANGTAWRISNVASQGNYTIQRFNGASWDTMGGLAMRIAVDPIGNAWIVNAAGQIYRWNGTWWDLMPGAAQDVGVGADGSVWVIGTSASSNGAAYKWNGTSWDYVGGAGIRISVGPDGNPWVVSAGLTIQRYVAGSFQTVTGTARDVGISPDGIVWIIGSFASAGGYDIKWWTGNGWNQVPGVATAISVERGGRPWVVNGYHEVYRSY